MAAMTLTQADNGRTVAAAPGQPIVLRLSENATTGYRWEPPAGLALMADEYRTAGDAVAGAAGERVFTFMAPAEATEALFQLKRAWGGDAPAASFQLRLVPAA